MRLKISDIPDDGFQRDLELDVDIHNTDSPDTAHVSLKVFKIGKKVLIEGAVKITVLLECSRCLKEVSCFVETVFKDEYNPAEEIEREEVQHLTEKKLDLSYYSNDELDIAELINEQILLAVPMKPLCSSGCSGICMKCGADLNNDPCGCTTVQMDPRLAPLIKLKNSMKGR